MTPPRLLVVLDVDSTLIEDEVIDLLAEEAGSGAEVAAITDAAMRGELDFEASLRARVRTLAGLDAEVFDRIGRRIRLTDGAREMIDGLHAAGHLVGCVSGGFHELLDPLAARIGLDLHRANRLRVTDGRLSGDVDGPVVDAAAKASTLIEWADAADLPLGRTIAVGDGANDLPMMAVAGLSVGFDAKAPVRAAAGVLLDERDLRAVLPLAGLPLPARV